MIPYETVRQKLMTLVKSFHDTNYPTMEVNYPKNFRTDVEHIQVPFVYVELMMTSQTIGINPRADLEVSGQLVFNHCARKGAGEKIFATYTDLLYTYLGCKTINSIHFFEVIPYDNSGIPGFDGVMNTVKWKTDFFNI